MNSINPFTVRLGWTIWDYLQAVVGFVVLLPLRFFLLVGPLMLIGPCMCLLTSQGDSMDAAEQKPLAGWRKTIRDKLFPKIARVFLFGFGFNWIRVKGVLKPQEEAPIIIIAPHTSILDTFVLGCFAIPTVLANDTIATLPLVGRAIRTFQPIFVDRQDKESRSRALGVMKRRATSRGEWSHIVVFPEGTTTNGQAVIHFKSGAFAAGLPVQPMLIKYSQNTMRWSHNGIHPLLGLMLTLCRPHNGLKVEFLPVHTPTAEEWVNPVLFAKNTRQDFVNALGLPGTLHCYEDLLLAKAARRLSIPMEAVLVEFASLPLELRLDFKWCRAMLDVFAALNYSGSGLLSPEQAETGLNLSPRQVGQLYSSFSRSKEEMAFKEFLLLCNHLLRSSPSLTPPPYISEDVQSVGGVARAIQAFYPSHLQRRASSPGVHLAD